MCEANLSSADQVVIFKGDFACLQAINLTAFTTGDLVFMSGKKFLPVGVSSQQNVVRWNSLLYINLSTTSLSVRNKMFEFFMSWLTCWLMYGILWMESFIPFVFKYHWIEFSWNAKSFRSYIFMSFYLGLSVQFCQYRNWIDSFEKSSTWTEYSNNQGLVKIHAFWINCILIT